MKKRIGLISALLSVILTVTAVFSVVTFHNNAYFSPDYEMVDLLAISQKDTLSDEDYRTVFFQTGLGRYAVDTLWQDADRYTVLKEYQQNFFKSRNYKCFREAITTSMEYNLSENGAIAPAFDIFDAKEGYVLIMESSHSFGWRHGHAGLVVDGGVLEAPIIGEPSAVYPIYEWRYYTSFIMLRLKNTSDEKLKELAQKAEDKLTGIIYNPLTNVFDKTPDGTPQRVQCAYLVWYAFYLQGIDVDSDGGRIVTVADIKNSDLFEVVQIYGCDPLDFS